MLEKDNKYTQMQQDFYNATADIMAIDNHRGHDSNPDYHGILLSDIVTAPEKWFDKTGLDFGCGIGRNVDNLLKLADWKFFDGCDISSENIKRANDFLSNIYQDNFNLYTTSGIDLSPIKSDCYDFVMSTIVLQHIAVHDIRFNIINDIYRVLKNGGLFSFQMAQYDREHISSAGYYDNVWDAAGTNGRYDVSIEDPKNLIDDLEKVGFNNCSYLITNEWDANHRQYVSNPHSRWIWVKAWK